MMKKKIDWKILIITSLICLIHIRADFWKKVKRPAGYFFVIIGLAFIISAFLNSIVSLILLGIIIVVAILITIYSIYLFYKDRK